MKIVLIKNDKLYSYSFSDDSTQNYWIKDYDFNDKERDLISIDKIKGKWYIFSNELCSIKNNNKTVREIEFVQNNCYSLSIKENDEEQKAFLYYDSDDNSSFKSYEVLEDKEYTIGNDNSDINLLNCNISSKFASLSFENGHCFVKIIDENGYLYVNNIRTNHKELECGDVIFIFGYKIIVANYYIIINKSVKINTELIVEKDLPKTDSEITKTIDDDNATLYLESDYYDREPRFTRSYTEKTINIDNPPTKVEQDDTPIIFTIGPMITMTMTSVVSMSTSVITILNGNGSFTSVIPTLIIGLAMLASTILWPTLMRRYNSKKQLKNETERKEKYKKYLDEKRNIINSSRTEQYNVLIDNYPEFNNLENIILGRQRSLWERQIISDDFLNVRVGVGNVPLKIKLNYASEDFTMIEDELKNDLFSLAENTKDIKNCPVVIDLTIKNKLVIIGNNHDRESMIKNILLQLATYHAYDDLKFVFMINDSSSGIWDNFKILPHTWSDLKGIRFYAKSYEEMEKISFYLEQVYNSRKYADDNGKQVEINTNYKNTKPYYLIVVDNIKRNKNIDIIKKLLKEENNLGFGLIILNENVLNLPNECNDFIKLQGENSLIITNDLNKDKQQQFVMDNIDNVNIGLLCEKLSNIPIKASQTSNSFNNSIGFLEMYKVGRVEQLNVIERWKNNNIVNSLSVPIGIKSDGELFTLDLHEKFHGPHGLIAGMTGSGKSEFIITLILSMCVNYSPEEVSFVLIDYKGGGLTGAFENKLTGIKLPHLAGTITNLDTAEIKRSLSSIKSELNRRQELFNEVKLKLNESTIDIYKYQELYRSGAIKEPISHLFIISDEFAELKSQQPQFMDELISTARIGRSLGVHLILATQKPSGVVDDQIWSNSKFKVSLKVQEKSDSMDVIKRPDAVTLTNVGRFYLLVGYNDYFALGQAAWAGNPYVPRDKSSKQIDRDIAFINNIGNVIKKVETVERTENVAQGEELSNILKYIYNCAVSQNLHAKKLWLDRLGNELFVTNLIKKYSFKPFKWNIIAVIGEYDDPSNQKQGLLTLNFNEGGNTIIYGSSGKEIMLSSIIYSLIINHSADEINIYIADFGSEMLGVFSSAPQIGDVVFINEQEKLNNLFTSIAKELENRKKLFVDYNGSYNLYIKNSGKYVPYIIIVINNYEVLNENYENYIDIIASLSREGEKYGISFILTASGANSIRIKTSQNFNNNYCLQFNNPDNYITILGPTHGMVPSEVEGRGLVKMNGGIFEFQTAYPYKWAEINTYIKNICALLNQKILNKAPKIAILPNHVRLEDVSSSIDSLKNIPIGIEKNTLQVSTFDFLRNAISLVAAQELSMMKKFVISLGEVIQKVSNVELYMVDASEEIENTSLFENYYSTNSEGLLNKLQQLSIIDSNKSYVFLIYDVEAFMNCFSDEDLREIKKLFSNLKNRKNIRVIFADAISKIKTLEYEDFYRNIVQPIYGIWVGSGISEQYVMKCSSFTKETRSQLENDFGFNVDKSNATLIKLLDFFTED